MESINTDIFDLANDFNNITKAAEILQKGYFRKARDIYIPILNRANKINFTGYNIIKQLVNHHLGSIELYNHNFLKAKYYFEEAIKFAEEESKSFLNKMLAESLICLGDYKSAIAILELNLIKKDDKNDLNNLILLARAYYLLDPIGNAQKSLTILEDQVLKLDPNNIDGLAYLSDIAIKRGIGNYVLNHIILAIAYSSINMGKGSKQAIEISKKNFVKLINLEENKNRLDAFNNDMSIYRHLAQLLKEFGSVEMSLYAFKRGFDFLNVKNNKKEIVLAVTNITGTLEVLNRYQESFEFIKSFYNTYKEMKVGDLLNIKIFEIIKDLIIQDSNIIFNNHENDKFNYDNSDKSTLQNNLDNIDSNENHQDSKLSYSEIELEILAIHFTLIKILYVKGLISTIHKLIKIIYPITLSRDLHHTIIRNQNSYFLYISKLINYIKFPIPENSGKIYICGDSHSLALSWQLINNRLIVPKLVTGLKCWHMKDETLFFTKKNFDVVIESIPINSTVIFVFGEIDCREGIIGAYEKCKYETLEAGVKFTADIYLNKINELKNKRGIKALIHPVPPVLDITRKIVNMFNEYLGNQKIVDYLNFHKYLLTEDGNGFNKEFILDGTHMSPNYKILLEKYLY